MQNNFHQISTWKDLPFVFTHYHVEKLGKMVTKVDVTLQREQVVKGNEAGTGMSWKGCLSPVLQERNFLLRSTSHFLHQHLLLSSLKGNNLQHVSRLPEATRSSVVQITPIRLCSKASRANCMQGWFLLPLNHITEMISDCSDTCGISLCVFVASTK